MLQKGEKISEGKTKVVWQAEGDRYTVIIENKTAITALDDPDRTREFATKAVSATRTTCRVFELLRRAALPVAYDRQLSETEFSAPYCVMVPLEVVVRRDAVGSYLKRHPEYKRPAGEMPYRFEQLVVEFFLKTTGGKLQMGDHLIVDGLDPKAGEEDPLIANPYEENWRLVHPKKPSWDPTADLGRTVRYAQVVPSLESMHETAALAKKTFLVLEGAWAALGYRLIDFKIEFGRDLEKSRLYIADVIDNDSWRLRDSQWNELSKQLFRDGQSLALVEDRYTLVANLVERFQVPQQALVLWRGSPGDEFPVVEKDTLRSLGLDVIEERPYPASPSDIASTRRSSCGEQPLATSMSIDPSIVSGGLSIDVKRTVTGRARPAPDRR